MYPPEHKYPTAEELIPPQILTPLLSACYALDLALCCSTRESTIQVRRWHADEPLPYLNSINVMKAWKDDVENLLQRYDRGQYEAQRSEFLRVLKGLLPHVEKLEAARNALVAHVEEQQKKCVDPGCLSYMCEALEWRCSALESAFVVEK
jgi:hypothetical protein